MGHNAEGLALIRCIITTEGIPTGCYVLRDLPHGMGEAILDMIDEQRFAPALDEQGRPIAVAITFPVRIRVRRQGP